MGRLVTSVLKQEPNLQIVYVDDLHILVWGQHKFLWLWMMIATYEIVGTPFGYHKFKGGLEIPFVGYELDYYRKTIGISQKRADWLQAFMMELERNKYTVPMRDFNEFLGRLGFVARILVWIKPHLAPLYSWSAALDRGCVATAPKMVRLVIRYLKSQLEALTRRLSSSAPLRAASEEFRTDAKCERGRVVLAGHHLCTKQWFIIEVQDKHHTCLIKTRSRAGLQPRQSSWHLWRHFNCLATLRTQAIGVWCLWRLRPGRTTRPMRHCPRRGLQQLGH